MKLPAAGHEHTVARDRQPRALEDALLVVQRQVIEELGFQHLGQQPAGGDALVDDLCRARCVSECVACGADPLAVDVASTLNAPGV